MALRDWLFVLFLGFDLLLVYILTVGSVTLPEILYNITPPYLGENTIEQNHPIFIVLDNKNGSIHMLQWYLLLGFLLQALFLNVSRNREKQERKYRYNEKELYPDNSRPETSRTIAGRIAYRMIIFMIFAFMQIGIADADGYRRTLGFLYIMSHEIVIPLLFLFVLFLPKYRVIPVLLLVGVYSTFVLI